MLTLLAKLHALLFRGCLWLLRLPFKALWAGFLAILMLLGEEFRRWAGIAMSGLLIVVMGKVTLNYAPPTMGRPIALAVLAFLALWALAVRRAIHLTRANNLFRVRNRKAFRDLFGEVRGTRRDMTEGLARATRGRRVGLVFGSNRRDRAAEREAAEQAAEREARRTFTEQAAKAERDQWAEQAGREHNPFAKQGR